MTNLELKRSTKITLGFAATLLGVVVTVGVKLWNVADSVKQDMGLLRVAIEAKPSREDVDRAVDSRLAVALQGLRIQESIAEIRAVLGIVREDLKELKHGK